jgi:predicted ATP-grasp superfamily ATP-dependent carboligase
VNPSQAGTASDADVGTGGTRADDLDLVLVGWSTRALADAALRSGYRPRTVDFFGDLDQRRRVPNLSLGRDLGRPWSPLEAARLASSLPPGPAVYGFDLENDPEAVEILAASRELLGNPASVLRAVRDPARLFGVLAEAGIPTPHTVFHGGAGVGSGRANQVSADNGFAAVRDAGTGRPGRWLVKPIRGGGGRGISVADGNRVPGPNEMLQERIDGLVLGFSFLADGRSVRPLALSSQIEERAAFGAGRFAYAGSLSCLPDGVDQASVHEQALRAAGVVTRAFGLRGWNGLDIVVRNGEVLPLEVNPRHTSSMDLWDAAGARLLAAHVEACRGRIDGTWLPRPDDVRGKALLFARRAVVARASIAGLAAIPEPEAAEGKTDAAGPSQPGIPSGGATEWPERAVADVPHPQERIAAGQPICSLYAVGPTGSACVAALRALAARVEGHLEPDPTAQSPSVESRSSTSSCS